VPGKVPQVLVVVQREVPDRICAGG
jgi:hypothetical protein